MDAKLMCDFCGTVGIQILENGLEDFNYKSLSNVKKKENIRGQKRRKKVFSEWINLIKVSFWIVCYETI